MHTKSYKRKASLLLVLVMLFALFTVFAVPSYADVQASIKLDLVSNANLIYNNGSANIGANPTTSNITDSVEGWKWYLTAADGYAAKTLVLNNFSIITGAPKAVVVPHGTTIVLIGTNTITSTSTGTSEDSYALYGYGVLNIQEEGAGSLTLQSGTASNITSNHNSCGAYVDGDLTIHSGTITAAGGSNTRSFGISCNARLTINNGTVSATSDIANGYNAALHAKEIVVNDGTVTATSADVDALMAQSYGIYIPSSGVGSFSMNGGSVTATAGKSQNLNSYGIDIGNRFFLTGGTINAISSDARGESFAAKMRDLSISGGTLTAICGEGTTKQAALVILNAPTASIAAAGGARDTDTDELGYITSLQAFGRNSTAANYVVLTKGNEDNSGGDDGGDSDSTPATGTVIEPPAPAAAVAQTGDSAQPMLWLLFAGVSALALTALYVARKKRTASSL